MPEAHEIEILEIPSMMGEKRYYQYLPICSCGTTMMPPPGRYWTERGAQIKSNQHFDLATGKLDSTSTAYADRNRTLREEEAHIPKVAEALVEARKSEVNAQGFRVARADRRNRKKDWETDFPVIRANQENR